MMPCTTPTTANRIFNIMRNKTAIRRYWFIFFYSSLIISLLIYVFPVCSDLSSLILTRIRLIIDFNDTIKCLCIKFQLLFIISICLNWSKLERKTIWCLSSRCKRCLLGIIFLMIYFLSRWRTVNFIVSFDFACLVLLISITDVFCVFCLSWPLLDCSSY